MWAIPGGVPIPWELEICVNMLRVQNLRSGVPVKVVVAQDLPDQERNRTSIIEVYIEVRKGESCGITHSVWNLRAGPEEFLSRVGPARKNFRLVSARPGRILKVL